MPDEIASSTESEPVPHFGEADAGTPEARRKLHEENRLSWNEATRAHNSHKRDQAKFFRDGGNKLFPEERALLGDVAGKSVLHLQCNSGQDTLSIKQLAAAKVTGVDISDEAIDFARQLAAESGLDATFHRADVYDWLAAAANQPERWDVVFSSYGAVCWLSDLETWARGIAAVLKNGGAFILQEFHPTAWMFDEHLKLSFPYSSHGVPMTWDDGVSDYVGESGEAITPSGWEEGVQNFRNPHRAHEFCWGLADIFRGFLAAGLQLEVFEEQFYTSGFRPFKNMREIEGRRWTVPEGTPAIPLMYGVVFRKSA